MNRKTIFLLSVVVLSAACFFTGCQSPKPPPGSSAAQSTRNNCYSLLHQLLQDQQNVSMLRFIKREHSDVRNLINRIATTSGASSKLLEEFARQDHSIDLKAIRLPPGETAVRKAIASTKEKEILGQSGNEFELTLLLTQTEALSYAWHLAKIAGQNDSQPDRARALTGVSKDMQHLYDDVFAMLLAKSQSSVTNSSKTL